MNVAPAIWAAAIAAVVSVMGFMLNQSWSRRDRRAKSFADAMAALTRWEQVPFTIWRRPSSSPEVRSILGKEITECYAGVTYHIALLRLESPLVGDAYVLLNNTLQQAKNDNQDRAWGSPLLTSDQDMTTDPPFEFVNAKPERDLCRLAMQRDLALWRRFTRKDTGKRLAELRARSGLDRSDRIEAPPAT